MFYAILALWHKKSHSCEWLLGGIIAFLFLLVAVLCVACVQAVDDVLSDVHRIVDVEDVVTDAAEDDVVSVLLVVVADECVDRVAEEQAVLVQEMNIHFLHHLLWVCSF